MLILELLDHLSVAPRYVYLHDFGAPVGLHIAMKAPEEVLGLIVQNANAHLSGHGPGWAATKAFWADPTPENEEAATGHLSVEGTRGTYITDVPPDVAARMSPQEWEEDWRVMCLPGRMDMNRALLFDYGKYVARFDAIADSSGPPAARAHALGCGTTRSSISPRPSHGCRLCRAWKPTYSTLPISCSMHSAEAAPLMRDFITGR